MRTELLLADDKGVMIGWEQQPSDEEVDGLSAKVVDQTLVELKPPTPNLEIYARAARHAARLGIREGYNLATVQIGEADEPRNTSEPLRESNESIVAAALFLGGISRKNPRWDELYAMVSSALEMAKKARLRAT